MKTPKDSGQALLMKAAETMWYRAIHPQNNCPLQVFWCLHFWLCFPTHHCILRSTLDRPSWSYTSVTTIIKRTRLLEGHQYNIYFSFIYFLLEREDIFKSFVPNDDDNKFTKCIMLIYNWKTQAPKWKVYIWIHSFLYQKVQSFNGPVINSSHSELRVVLFCSGLHEVQQWMVRALIGIPGAGKGLLKRLTFTSKNSAGNKWLSLCRTEM